MPTFVPYHPSRQLIPISALTLNSSTGLAIDVFLKVDAEAPPQLFCSHRLQVKPQQLQHLLSEGVTKLYIDRESYNAYQSYLQSNWKSLLEGDCFDEANRAELMCGVVREVLSEQFRLGDTSSIVKACGELSKSIIDTLHAHPVFVARLYDGLSHDCSMGTHSSNVAILIALLAARLGLSGNELQQIVAGALLHDIGNLEISDQILDKPNQLDEFEYREVQKHPCRGLRRLTDEHQELTYGQLMMVYQHHEKLNGTGYPVGLLGDEIHPWAKICAVVDIFVALTSHRPFRKPRSQATALAMLKKLSPAGLDEEMVRCWQSLVWTST